MTYSEQIRHPSAALNPPRDGEQGLSRLGWILVGLVVLLFFAWRFGWFSKIVATGAKAVSVANPLGWV